MELGKFRRIREVCPDTTHRCAWLRFATIEVNGVIGIGPEYAENLLNINEDTRPNTRLLTETRLLLPSAPQPTMQDSGSS